MRRLVAMGALLAVTARADVSWERDFERAKERAIAEDRLLFVEFNHAELRGEMEKVYRQLAVRDWLGKVVCFRVDVGEGEHPLAKQFGVDGFPTLVLMEPSGKILYNKAGAPAEPSQLVEFFGLDANNAAVKALMDHDARAAAPHLYFLRRWFAGTGLSKQADEIYDELKDEAGFAEAYEAAKKEYEQRLEAAREELRKKEERRKQVRAMKAEADALYKKYLRTKAYDVYRQILVEFPDTPEAEEAAAILRKNKQKLTK